jgi:cyclopropane fatty-acyl-phospholipid synthase-like methyltransferase
MNEVFELANRILRIISRRRWSDDEPAAGLTWGNLMTGDSLWSLYEKHQPFAPNVRILEIGPGYGRLLKTALERNIPFESYTALELSKARVERLRREFDLSKIHIIQGDIDTWTHPCTFNVVICSSTFEHLYPNCRQALTTVYRHLDPTGIVFIDFISGNLQWKVLQNFTRKLIYFEPNGTYIRVYPKEELVRLFAEHGFMVRAIDTCVLGKGKRGPVNRLVIVATRA